MGTLHTEGEAPENSVEQKEADANPHDEPVFTRRFWMKYAALWVGGVTTTLTYEQYQANKEKTFTDLLRANRLSGNIACPSENTVNVISCSQLPDSTEPMCSFELESKPTAMAWLNDKELIISVATGAFHRKRDLGAIYKLSLDTRECELICNLNEERGQEIFDLIYKAVTKSDFNHRYTEEKDFLLLNPKFGKDPNGNIFWSARNEWFFMLGDQASVDFQDITPFGSPPEIVSTDGLFKLTSSDTKVTRVMELITDTNIHATVKITDVNETVHGVILTHKSSCPAVWNQTAGEGNEEGLKIRTPTF